MLVLLAVLSLLWALRWPMTRSLGAYLLAQLLYIPAVELTWRFYGPGKPYAWVYCIFSATILLAIGRLAWESLATAKYRLRSIAIALILALFFAKMAFLGLGRPAAWFDWLVIGEGAYLVCAGIVVGISAPYTLLPDISLVLSVLWLCQALFRFGYSLHFPLWERANVYVPPLLGIAGFLFIGFRLRQRRHRTNLGARAGS
jgi:hypothetical protein